ncbi:hypothetical protein BKA64DRAFT_706257 [Cadophora sp. MPI-SDFR-AT-0126]|nr:hypothetical protein BKA64DRAFT_706257 [Leotiomycetes sp. MPI-SDFR-AT-0126]
MRHKDLLETAFELRYGMSPPFQRPEMDVICVVQLFRKAPATTTTTAPHTGACGLVRRSTFIHIIEYAMFSPTKAVPAQLGFLAIYNPSLGTTDETIEDQIVYYSTPGLQERSTKKVKKGVLDDAAREENNEQLRQIGLAQGMVEFGRSFSDGRAVDTVETEKSRIILHELEAGWWILASINLTALPVAAKASKAEKGKGSVQQETIEYSSREVKPAILLLGDLLRAHSTFLLHHASSMSALFVRTRRSKFVGILGRYWDTFLTTWNVLMHGNPANNLYNGIKIAACGELGMGVGEEDRGSGEREVLEGFVGRIDGLVDVIVSRFGEADLPESEKPPGKSSEEQEPVEPWLGSGNEPESEDGAIFLGTGALSRKSLRDVSHWMEDLYRWGPYAYGVIDNPSSNRRAKKFRRKSPPQERRPSPDIKKSRQVYSLSVRDKASNESFGGQNSLTSVPPMPVKENEETPGNSNFYKRRPSIKRGTSSVTESESDSNAKSSRFVQFLKLGYGSHWSLGSSSHTGDGSDSRIAEAEEGPKVAEIQAKSDSPKAGRTFESSPYAVKDSTGHFLIGLLGDIENDEDDVSDVDPEELQDRSQDDSNPRLLLRTLTVELEREEDARKETDISIDLGGGSKSSSTKVLGSEHTGTSNTSFESQDRNKTKKLRTVVYVNKPFIFVLLFELRTDALAFSSLYRSLHYQISPLLKPLLLSTAYRASKPDLSASDESATPIYDLVWDPKLLTTNSTIPNIPDPLQTSQVDGSLTWSRIEALNTHMQIINTYVSSSADKSALERTCKTSRGWWVVWTRIPDPEPAETPTNSGELTVPTPVPTPTLVKEQNGGSQKIPGLRATSQRTSTFEASMTSGPAHPFLETTKVKSAPKDKEIFLIRRAGDHAAAKKTGRFVSGSSVAASESSWTSGPGRLAQGIGVDTKRYIEGLLNLNR